MDSKRILEMAQQQIPDLAGIGKEVYKGTLRIEDMVAGIYYFDLSNKIPEDFDAYQEELLSEEFYSNPGSSQWNYYLFLLNNTLSPEQKKKIERNDRYARKFVLDEEGFRDFFHFEKGGEEIQNSIVAQWKGALDAADLQEVYGAGSYVEIFERFLANNTKKQKTKVGRETNSQADTIRFINRVLLKDSYRKYPQDIKAFRFGKVNLVQGINGVGKTSLFEAIELMLCGATFRNKHQLYENGCLEAEYNGSGNLERYQAKNPALYQSRDLSWYSTTNLRGNTLYNSFNRFNYFNADAAQQFSGGGSQDEISNALFNIVLGPEYSYLQERSSKMLTRVSPAYKKLETELAAMEGQLLAAEKIISAYRQPENLRTMTDNITASVTSIAFVNGRFDFRTQSALIEQENNRLQVTLGYFSEDNYSFDTRDEHAQRLSAFVTKKQTFSELIERMRGFNHELSEQQKTTKKLEGQLDKISSALSYLQDSRFIELRGLDARARKASIERQRRQFVKDALNGLDFVVRHVDLSIPVYLERLRVQQELEEKEIFSLDNKITSAISNLGTIAGLLKEIKLSGQRYLEIDTDAQDCPMCQTAFLRQVLEDRVRSVSAVANGATQAENIENDRKSLDVLKNQLIQTHAHIQNAEKIRSTYLDYFRGGDDVLIEEAIRLLREQSALISQTEVEIRKIQNVTEFARIAGKSEQDLKALDAAVEEILGRTIQISQSESVALEEAKLAIESSLADQENFRMSTMERRYATGLDLKKMAGIAVEEQVDLKVAEQRVNQEGDKLEAFRKHFESLSATVVLQGDASVTALKTTSDLLSADIASYRSATRGELEVNTARAQKKQSEAFELENRVRFERLKKAFETLKSLSENEESEKQLQEFFNQNFTEIADIFRAIHMPREFTDLRFDGKEVTLKDESGMIRGVTQISTGQRSALALSIFLSLNRKLSQGPNLIMFDDPVAFIDDFNALSFLDYLRNYVLSSGRQIFFATANERLANLFEKKFGFLGEHDFVRYDLTR
ncbi:ABC-three component system middle component 1 [Pedobacter hartonius]|uniref:DNA repair exonuclease SbcCD ATPase subunit n=1 Tax=Pedobacter hartonius TaxID=425514 RepID=A0A1H4FYI9_9SPHI|nr:ABC-three component system middle component 1 [Pedobacter hartonius]SEB02419.1 DNA repair exonuclease SbcCD ATPase subunit [Pedobacter hartonius]